MVLLIPISILCVDFQAVSKVTTEPLAANSESADLQFGINYYATYHHYEEQYYLSNDTLDRDFSLFQNQGIKFVILEAIWAYHERTEGNYNEEAIEDLIRVCSFAAKYDLSVVIDFHTRMGSNSWTMPTWLTNRNFETVLLNETAKQSWLNFLSHMAYSLNNLSNLESWQMMNEPGWQSTLPAENFTTSWVNLWKEMRDVFKSYSDRLVSIRFDEALVRSDYFNSAPEIGNEICDYLSYNWYIQYRLPDYLNSAVSYAKEHNRTIMISEFGSNATLPGSNVTDKVQQAEHYSNSLDLFRSLGVDSCAAFFWRADYKSTNPADPPGEGYNLAEDVNGTPREAFYYLGNPSPTPSPTPISTPTTTQTHIPSPSPPATPTDTTTITSTPAPSTSHSPSSPPTPSPSPPKTPTLTPQPNPTIPGFPIILITMCFLVVCSSIVLILKRRNKPNKLE